MAKNPKVKFPIENALGMKARHIVLKQTELSLPTDKDYFCARLVSRL